MNVKQAVAFVYTLFHRTKVKIRSQQLLSNVKNATDFTGFTSQFNFHYVNIFTMRDRERERPSFRENSEWTVSNQFSVKGKVCSRHWALCAHRLTLQVCLWHKAGSVITSARQTQALIHPIISRILVQCTLVSAGFMSPSQSILCQPLHPFICSSFHQVLQLVNCFLLQPTTACTTTSHRGLT